MAQKIQLKRNATPASVPAAGDLDYGELAVNYADGKVYLKKADNSIVEVGGSSAISSVLEDTSPQLGGTLDANGNIIDMGTNNITDTKVGQWDTAFGWGDHGTQGYLTDVLLDSSPALGGDLDANANNIYSVGQLLVGSGTAKTDMATNSALVTNGDSGQTTVNTNADDLVVERNANVGITLLCPASNDAYLMFGSPTDNHRASIRYDHNSDIMWFRGAGTNRFQIEANGTLHAQTTNYENLITNDDDIPNKKYVDDEITAAVGTALGNVGTYAFLKYNGITNPGTTRSGSSLTYSNHTGASLSGTNPAGTWRLMGYLNGNTASVWLRIS